MRRRDFFLGLSAAPAWSSLPRVLAQSGRVRRVGAMLVTAEHDLEGQARLAIFRETLRDLGWMEGQNLELIPRWIAGDAARARTLAAELLAGSPDAVLTSSAVITRSVQGETSTVPIVFVQVIDPVGQGIVQSLARPGGNITGFTHFEAAMGGKWLGVLKETVPAMHRVGFLYSPDAAASGAGSATFLRSFESYAASVAVTPVKLPARNETELRRGMEMFAAEGGGGLLVPPDIFNTVHRDTIVAEAMRLRLPTIFPYRFYAVAGGLMSYGVNTHDLYRRAAEYVDRILKGEKPTDMPVQFPTKFELVINLKTAKALGLTIPPALLARADEVIE